MKRFFENILIIIVFCLFLAANVYAQQSVRNIDPNGHNIFRYPNGNIESEGVLRNGQPEGFWKSYYPTGILRSEGNRVNTLLDSTWVFYTQIGDTMQVINYQLGKRSGYLYQYETITEKNRVSVHYLKSKELFLDDQREGESYYYFPSGKLRQTVNYRRGRRQGFSKEYDENGTVITIYEYNNDHYISRQFINRFNAQGEKTGTWKTFYPNGSIKEEEHYRNGVLDGSSRVFAQSRNFAERGITIDEKVFRDGVLIADGIQFKVEPVELTSYYEDGKTIRQRGLFLDSIPIGRHNFFNKEGKPERQIRYSERGTGVRIAEGPIDENERLTGDWRNYSETGQLRSSGRYSNNAPIGEWTFYNAEGKVEQTGFFNSNGRRDGNWKWYYPSGELFRDDFMIDGVLNGMSIQYSDSATIVAKGEYVDGQREGFWIEVVGHSREEGNYSMDEKEGVWKTYHKDGRLSHTGNFIMGNPDGRHLFYYPDGTLKEEQHYIMGRRFRNWKKYYENGALFLTITYHNDEEIRINGMRIDR